MLSCDETLEIRVILKEMRKLFDAAWELYQNGCSTELSRMVTTYIPNIEQSYLYFVEKEGWGEKDEKNERL